MSDDKRLLTTYEVFDIQEREALTESIEKDGTVLMKGILQKADTLNQNGRIYPTPILEREVRNYQKFISERRALGELDHPDTCVPTGTEIFTCKGWKKIEDVVQGEVVATINPETEEIQFQQVKQKIDNEYSGKMYRFKNARTYDMTVTPNHRVLVWDRNKKPKFIRGEDVYNASKRGDSALSHSGLRRTGRWIGEEPESINIAGKEIDSHLWAAFLGMYLADGHSSGVYAEHRQKLHTVVITQNIGETCDAIRDLCEKLPWDFEEKENSKVSLRRDFIITDEKLHEELIPYGGSHTKSIPLYAKKWGTKLLKTLLDWMLAGDGRHRYGYKKECIVPEYCTTSPQLADDTYEIMLKLGSGATIHTYQPEDRPAPDFKETGRMILKENSQPMNIVYQHSTKGISLDQRFMQAEEFDYDGMIHCVVTDNSTWLMRQNGKVCWTGNSVVNLKNVSHIVKEASMDANGVVSGTVEILDTPSGQVLKSLIKSNVKLGISSRGVGSTKKQGDYYVVQEDFQLICWDFVSEPSTPGAFMLPEGKKINTDTLDKVFNKSDKINRIITDILSK